MDLKRCVDSIACAKTDQLYQWYLVAKGSVKAFTFLCNNDTKSGVSELIRFMHASYYTMFYCIQNTLKSTEAIFAHVSVTL